ncbi:TRAP transporter substrate-binding protein [Arcobacter sp. CECT 8985]|uniref:TRAP transporter substrate-binding protein n=1 Tax=Arcobacter sp. CECT 8985 TaxID=1935424 RepID=UPI00100B0DCF|nr:TRAP transporter substrate-binding protein DctP [Arcobacter sp. CECT 8985]RXJ86880.1 ABC transporter substrate-binding protein [Arcobacter sp. CECT 8985]
MKKSIIKVFILLTMFILIATTANAREYRLKMATTWGKTASPLIDIAKEAASLAQTMSNGELKIRVDSANKHKAPFDVLDMVKAGQYDIGHSASYYWKGKDINTLPFTSMPFGMTAPEQYAWFYYGGGLELMQKAYKRHKVLSFPGGNTGVQMGGWFKKQINSLSDLKGLKMRIPGFAGEIMAKVGVLVTNVAPGELYTSLERGNIDALEWVGPSMDIKMGFHRVAKYYYTGWHEPASEMQFIVNKRTYNKLPKRLQKVLVLAFKLAAYDMYIKNYDLNAKAWEKMKKQYPQIKVKSFPKDVMQALKKANNELRAKMAAKSPILKEVFKSQEEYMKIARDWTKISNYQYIKSSLE